ncbi:MAG: FAD-dependent oxidoreductase [Desulfocapsaceae bacterium]|nr:FAD-dependent oxidoreductase [Desulfocapsaceae bacterium]
MPKRVVIIGAVALGPKVACRLRRLDPDVEITVIDRDDMISYGGCGIPYYVGGDVNEIEDLCSTASHAIRDPEFFRTGKGIAMLTRVEALAIDRKGKRLKIRHLEDGKEEHLSYDKLVIATGSAPVRPPFPGADLPRVKIVSNLHDAQAVKDLLKQGKVGRAVIVGAGAIGIELAEAMTDLWGVETTVIELADQVLPAALGKTIGRIAKRQMEDHGVKVMLSERVIRIGEAPDTGSLLVETLSETLSCDLVVLSTGIRPNSMIASAAGLAVGRSGGILVDSRLRTSDPDIYASGDCIELRHLISGENQIMPLGSLANRQGRIIADNISGGSSLFTGTVGAFCLKVFDLGISKAGLTFRQARAAGFDPVFAVVSQPDHAHFYPSANLIFMTLIADRRSRKILGIEAAGKNGAAVKARVDAVAVMLRHGLDVEDVCTLETGYAPPFSSAMDVINNAGNVLDNILAGRNRPIGAAEFLEKLAAGEMQVLDVREAPTAKPFVDKYKDRWLNIPLLELRARLAELPRQTPLGLLCDTGPRSYEAQVILDAGGITDTLNLQGGYAMILATGSPLL